MRLACGWITLACASLGFAQTGYRCFTPEDRDLVLTFWSAPGRYSVSLPPDAAEKGAWQVRLTPEGSTWLWNYGKGRKIGTNLGLESFPPMGNPPEWEVWVKTKLNRDRWDAWQAARKNNLQLTGRDVPVLDKSLPATEPPPPNPIPQELVDSCGVPPRFAEAVVPMQHRVHFDDCEVTYRDHVKLSNTRYAFYRSANGVLSEGTSMRKFPPEKLGNVFRLAGCNDSEAKIMRAVSSLEGGFDSVNTYDTGFVSIGFIQFASLKDGAGALGGLLWSYKRDAPDHFQKEFRQFGIDVSPFGVLSVIDLATGAELSGPAANAKIIDDKRLIAIFQRAGQLCEGFQAAQVRAAKAMFFPSEDTVSVNFGGRSVQLRVGDFIRSEAGLATLMDRKVNMGRMDPLSRVTQQVIDAYGATNVEQLAAQERFIVGACKHRKDFLGDASLSQPGPGSPQPPASRGSGGTRGKRKKG